MASCKLAAALGMKLASLLIAGERSIVNCQMMDSIGALTHGDKGGAIRLSGYAADQCNVAGSRWRSLKLTSALMKHKSRY